MPSKGLSIRSIGVNFGQNSGLNCSLKWNSEDTVDDLGVSRGVWNVIGEISGRLFVFDTGEYFDHRRIQWHEKVLRYLPIGYYSKFVVGVCSYI